MTLARRVAAVITVCTLAGAPAVLSACVTLCLPEMPGHAQIASAAGDGEAEDSTPATAAPTAAVHDHHAMGHDGVPATVPAPATSARLSTACDDCCPDGVQTAAQAVVPLRQDAHALVATLVAPEPGAAVWLTEQRPPLIVQAIAPPSPPRSSAVLRI